jgi:hypothetical protein
MKFTIATIVAVFILGIATGCLSCHISSTDWWGSYLQNLSAELIGIALGILVAFFLTKILAGRALKLVAPSILSLITTLREKDKIDGDIARALVVTVVTILREANVIDMRKELNITSEETICPVCGLNVEKGPCKHCNLPEAVWNLPKKTRHKDAASNG